MQTLLLINGYAATGADWDPQFLAGMDSSFELICPDNPGLRGPRPVAGQPLTIEAMARDLAAALDERRVKRAVVAGWSMGGFIAQRLVALVPERISGLALLATDPGGPAAVLPDPAVWSRLTDHSGTPREQASRLISLLFPPNVAAEIDREFGEIVAESRAQLSVTALEAQEQAMEAWHGVEQETLTAAPVETLVIHGTEDAVIPPENAALLGRLWASDAVELVEGGGHALMAQEPQRVSKLIAEAFAA